jgi:hypothetical protein
LELKITEIIDYSMIDIKLGQSANAIVEAAVGVTEKDIDQIVSQRNQKMNVVNYRNNTHEIPGVCWALDILSFSPLGIRRQAVGSPVNRVTPKQFCKLMSMHPVNRVTRPGSARG